MPWEQFFNKGMCAVLFACGCRNILTTERIDLMRIGLVSDTHVPETGPEIPPQVYAAFEGVDMIFHAGDMHVNDVLDWLETVAPTIGARGNGDYPTPWNPNRPGLSEDPRVKDSHVVRVGHVSVGLIHGFPLPEEVPWRTIDELFAMYFSQAVDVVVCGDTHVARIDRYENLLVVNPGSPTLPNQVSGLGTVGFLDIVGNQITPSILQLT